jgi:hypothetical protein
MCEALLSRRTEDRRRNWTSLVNEAVAAAERKRLKVSLEHRRPLGTTGWALRMAQAMGLQYAFNPRPDAKTEHDCVIGCHRFQTNVIPGSVELNLTLGTDGLWAPTVVYRVDGRVRRSRFKQVASKWEFSLNDTRTFVETTSGNK